MVCVCVCVVFYLHEVQARFQAIHNAPNFLHECIKPQILVGKPSLVISVGCTGLSTIVPSGIKAYNRQLSLHSLVISSNL